MKKYNFMVCPHDTARKPERWYLFAQLLGKKLGSVVSFEPCLDFKEFHEKLTTSDIIYANPQDSLRLYRDENYIPLAHADNLYDEVVFIANTGLNKPSLQAMNANNVVSVRSMMPTCLAIEHLDEANIRPSTVENRDSWMAVIKAVYKGDVPFGFVYKDFYEGLNSLTRSSFDVIGGTDDKKIFHMFMLSPEHAELTGNITDALLNLHLDSQADAVLGELNMHQFLKVKLKTLDDLGILSKALEKFR